MVCFFPLQALPKWMIAHPDAIQTGIPVLDNVLTVLLSTSILVGGILGCFLDNLIPGKIMNGKLDFLGRLIVIFEMQTCITATVSVLLLIDN